MLPPLVLREYYGKTKFQRNIEPNIAAIFPASIAAISKLTHTIQRDPTPKPKSDTAIHCESQKSIIAETAKPAPHATTFC